MRCSKWKFWLKTLKNELESQNFDFSAYTNRWSFLTLFSVPKQFLFSLQNQGFISWENHTQRDIWDNIGLKLSQIIIFTSERMFWFDKKNWIWRTRSDTVTLTRPARILLFSKDTSVLFKTAFSFQSTKIYIFMDPEWSYILPEIEERTWWLTPRFQMIASSIFQKRHCKTISENIHKF